MADVISRLKLESGEFDSKIKRAGQELMAYSEHCKKMGLEMGYANKDAKDFAKALGSMQTTSSSARGKINELTEAFVNLKVMYKNMTDEEKNNTFGKNLAASLDQLKTRIDQAKAELNDVNKELGNTKQAEVDTKGGLEGLTSALGINIKTLAGWGTAIAAGNVALDVAKDAFFASESSVDEWGRTVASSQSLYEGFLTALNTGDISGYLSRIDEIVSAARTAYNELDRLGTMKTIQAPKVSAQQTENERIRSMIQTGRYIAPVDGRRNAVFNGREMQNGDKLTAGQIRALEKQLQNGMQNVVKLVGNEVKQTGKAIDAVYERQAKELGISLKEFRKGTSSMEEFDKRMAGYDKYQQWREQHTTIDQQSGREIVARGNPYAEYGKWGTFRVDGDRYNQLVQLIQQRDQQAAQAYGMQSQAYRTMNRAEGVTVRQIMGDTGGKGGNTIKEEKDDFVEVNGLINMATERVNDLQKRIREAPTENMITELRDQLKDAQAELDRLNGKDVVEMATGLSGFNEQTISAWTSMMKADLQKADLGSALYSSLTNNMEDMSRLTQTVQSAIKLGLDVPQDTVQQIFERIFDGENMPADMYDSMIQKFIEDFKERTGKDLVVGENGGLSEGTSQQRKDERDGNRFMKKNDEGKYEAKMTDIMSGMAGGINNVVSGLNTLGVEIPAGLQSVLGGMQAITSILSGIAVTAMAIEAIAGADAIIPFAGGGIVPAFAHGGLIGRAAGGLMIPGNSMSGDRLRLPVDGGLGMIGVNSGELILNRAQQGNLASQLEGGVAASTNTQPFIDGEMIYLGLQAYMRRSGLGEIVTAER